MVTNSTSYTEVAIKKDSVTDAKCFNCGKKLFECDKFQGKTAKISGICVSIKCNRCKQLNHFVLK